MPLSAACTAAVVACYGCAQEGLLHVNHTKCPLPTKDGKVLEGAKPKGAPSVAVLFECKFSLRDQAPKLETHEFRLDRAYHQHTSSQQIYEETTRPLVALVVQGGVGTVIAYGQTSSGKTYTISALQDRLCTDLFAHIAQQQHMELGLSVFEIDGDKCLDLLGADNSDVSQQPGPSDHAEELAALPNNYRDFLKAAMQLPALKTLKLTERKAAAAKLWREKEQLKATQKAEQKGARQLHEEQTKTKGQFFIREDNFGEVQLRGLSEQIVSSAEELRQQLTTALQYRRTAATLRNDASSRTHAVARFRCYNRRYPASRPGVLYIIDLAGSERASDQAQHDKERLEESRTINFSLMTLKESLRSRSLAGRGANMKHIPYRETKITLLLKDVLALEAIRVCKTVVIACLAPSVRDFNHTANTLRYAAPIRVGMAKANLIERHKDDPVGWSHDELLLRLEHMALPGGLAGLQSANLAPQGFQPAQVARQGESGEQLCRLPEQELVERIMAAGIPEHRHAQKLFLHLWSMVVDARTRKLRTATRQGQQAYARLDQRNASFADFLNRKRDTALVSERSSDEGGG
eukprot:g82697.t1